MKYLHNIGQYFIMLGEAFSPMTKREVMYDLIMKEIDDLIIDSLGIVSFLSFFIGGVVTIQMSLNLSSPFLPKSLIGFAARQIVILEFAPTLISIIIAGKVGSYITSSIGTMRVTEQIDALEVMGINPVNYLVFPKIVAMMLFPFVIAISMFIGLLGAYLAGIWGGYAPSDAFIAGLREDFIPFQLAYAFIKTFFFSFLLATIPSFFGFYLKGGSLEVGRASTTAFIWTSVALIVTNYILTQLLLA